jgi:hypothetical protein
MPINTEVLNAMNLTKKSFYLSILGLNFTAVFYFLIQPLLSFSCQDLLNFFYQAKNAPIVSLKYNFQEFLLLNIKTFLSRGILLFLTFWVSIYILFLIQWKGRDPFFQKLCAGLIVALIAGTVGIYFHNQTKLIAYNPMEPTITLKLGEKDELKQIIEFDKFDEKFLKYLKKAESGEVRLSILNANTANETQTHDMARPVYQVVFKVGDKIVNSPIKEYLEPHLITELLKTKRLSYIYKINKDGYFYLYLRAAGKSIIYRKDQIILNGKSISISPDNLSLVFRFEDLSGKPLIAFY